MGTDHLRKTTGLIHVGANVGQEAGTYARHGFPVVWVEPIPHIFDLLEKRVQKYKNHIAINALITDQDGVEYDFNISNNNSVSSSIFVFGDEFNLWPGTKYVDTIKLRSSTLPSILRLIPPPTDIYNTLVVDVESAELLVLKGAEPILSQFDHLFLEAANWEAWKGGCQESELDDFLFPRGFSKASAQVFNQKGKYRHANILYVRSNVSDA